MFNLKLICSVGAMVGLLSPLHAQSGIALLYSDHSRTFFERYADCATKTPGATLGNGDEYSRYVDGWRFVLGNLSAATTMIHDADLTEAGLAPFRVLVLANAVSLSDDQMKDVETWVRGGGRLLATFGSGYKDIVVSAPLEDLKPQRGGTGGLHNLWRDPLNKLFSSNSLELGVPFVKLTQPDAPPTDNLAGLRPGNLLPYGFLANMLIQRPAARDDVFGTFVFDAERRGPAPAIMINRASKGLVVYFAFAPEFAVALENNLPRSCSSGTGVYTESASAATSLMTSTVLFLLGN